MNQNKKYLGKKSWQVISFPITSLIIMAAINLDGFWHVSIGRDSLFIPPHLILYSSLAFLFLFLYKTKGTVPKITWIFAVLIVSAAPFDDWWHANFGIEELNNILIVWSPPHLMVELSLIGLFVIVLRKLITLNAKFSLTLQWAAISSLVLFTLIPLDVLSPYQALGVFGGLINLMMFGFLVYTYFELRGTYLFPYALVMFALSIPLYLQEGPETVFEKIHVHLPLTSLAIISLTPAAIVDAFFVRKSYLLRTTLFLLTYVIIYLGGHIFLINEYQQFWYILPVYAMISISAALFAHKFFRSRFSPTSKKLHNVA